MFVREFVMTEKYCENLLCRMKPVAARIANFLSC